MNALQLQQEPVNDLLAQAEADKELRQAYWKAHKDQSRSFRGEPHRRHSKQADRHELGEGYDLLPTLTGWIATEQGFTMAVIDYSKLAQVAVRFAIKAKLQDQDDLLHDIIIGLADASKAMIAKGEPFSEQAMFRTAEHIKDHYWHKRYAYYYGLDCQHCSKEQKAKCSYNWQHADFAYVDCHKAIQLESLNQVVSDSEGNMTEIGDLLLDNNASDIDLWLDAKMWLIKAPIKLKSIVLKQSKGEALSIAERVYLSRLRKREQAKLL